MIQPRLDRFVDHHIHVKLLRDKSFQEKLKFKLDLLELEREVFKEAPALKTRFELLENAIQHAEQNGDGLWLEFGVSGGKSINFIASKTQKTVYGFDSFRGLPEDWTKGRHKVESRGSMTQQDQIPAHSQNVRLIKGWFQDTLPAFIQENRKPAAFVHIDSDLYSSAKCVLDHLSFQQGSVIIFDEYFNYPFWREGEYRAFQEFLAKRSYKARCLAYCPSDKQAAFILETAETP